MDIIAIVAYIVLFVISFILYRRLSNPIVFYNLIWLVWITVSTTGFLGFYTPGGHIYKMFIIGGFAFNLVGHFLMLLEKVFSSKSKGSKTKPTPYYEYRKIIFTFLQFVMFAYYMSKAVELLISLRSGMGYDEVRGFYYSEENFTSPLEYRIVMFLFDPIVMVSEIIFAINIFDKQCNKVTTILMFCNIFLRSIISGGRMIIFELSVFIVVNFVYQYRNYIKYKKGKLKVGVVVSIATLVASYITSGRVQEENTLAMGAVKTLISNFTGPFTYLDILNRQGNYTTPKFGNVMFAGITDTFRMLTNGLNLTDFDLLRNDIGLVLADYCYIGSKYFNAMPSMYYFFICDFGKNWYFVGNIIFAIIAVGAYAYSKKAKSCKALAIYLLIMLVIAESSITFLFFNTSFVMAIFYAFFFLSNDKLPKIKQYGGVTEN